MNFSGIGCTLEAKTTVSNSTLCYLFISDFKKYTVSGVTFSFKRDVLIFQSPGPLGFLEVSKSSDMAE